MTFLIFQQKKCDNVNIEVIIQKIYRNRINRGLSVYIYEMSNNCPRKKESLYEIYILCVSSKGESSKEPRPQRNGLMKHQYKKHYDIKNKNF